MPTTIKAGIIGTGFIGPAHVEALRRLGNVEVVGVAEANQELADAKAEAMSIPNAYGDYKKLLENSDIQVVHNCTPNHLHFAINKDILAAGKHVVSEKPLAMNSKESSELVALAKESGKINAVNFNYRFYPLVQHARAMVESGEVGDIYNIHGSYLQDWLYYNTDWNWRLQPELSGDSRAIADIGSHWCDLMQFISGQSITRVMADLQTIHKNRMKPKKEVETYAGKELQPEDYEEQPINTEDYASVLFELSSGAHGVFTVSQVAAGRKNRLYFEIDGGKCALSWDQESPNEMWIGYRNKANELLAKDPSLLHEDAREYAHYPGGHPEAYPDGPKNLFRNVYRAVAEGGSIPSNPDWSTFLDGHKEVAICEAILASNKSQSWTDVSY